MLNTDLAAFALPCLLLLIAPGPTNALLAASGSLVGIRRSLPLVVAELAAYAVSITALSLALAEASHAHAMVATVLKLAAAALLLVSAWRLWRGRRQGGASPDIGVAQVFIITLINPKGLIFAFGLFPPPQELAENPLFILAFAASAIVAALCWLALGKAAARGSRWLAHPENVAAAMSVVLAGFALILAGSTLAKLV